MEKNFILRTDSYKLSHHAMMSMDTDGESYYLEARVGKPDDPYPDVVWVGLQPVLHQLAKVRITEKDIDEAEAVQEAHMPGTYFNRSGWERVVNKHGGKLPITIKSVPEGSVVPRGNVLLTVESTDCPWLPSHLEDILLRPWYPSTVATRDVKLRRGLEYYARKTGSPVEGVKYQVHDFGYRGVTCDEQAAIGGAAHLMVFRGTDTMVAMRHLFDHYGATRVSGGSVAASQHAIMTQNGRRGEHALIDRIITQHPGQIVSIVADSYDYYAFVDAVIDRHEVAKKNQTQVVIRPDSVTDQHQTPEKLVEWTLQRMLDRMPWTTTSTGHHVLPYKVLWGDGIDDVGMLKIAQRAEVQGFASSNLVFGSGGWLLQKCNRDTLRWAMKLSSRLVGGEWQDVQKMPLDRSKASKAGRLALIKTPNGYYYTTPERDLLPEAVNLLEPVFKDGMILRQQCVDDIRDRIDAACAAQTPMPVAV